MERFITMLPVPLLARLRKAAEEDDVPAAEILRVALEHQLNYRAQHRNIIPPASNRVDPTNPRPHPWMDTLDVP